MTDNLTISIPIELARIAVSQRALVNKYQVNHFIKAVGTWLVLKSITRSGIIQDWNQQKNYLLQYCKCSETIFRQRLRWLQANKYLSYDKKNIRVHSFDQVGAILNIDLSKKTKIQYEKDNKQHLHEWLIAAEINDNKNRQDYMILKQVNKNPELNMKLTGALIKEGADRNRLKDSSYFLGQMKAMYLSDFVQASDIHDDLINVRPDNNRSVRGIAKAWNAKHAMTISYWKKKLQTSGIIDISKLQVQSCERVRNKHCKVIWLKKDKETLLVMPDQITVLQPWLLKNFLPA